MTLHKLAFLYLLRYRTARTRYQMHLSLLFPSCFFYSVVMLSVSQHCLFLFSVFLFVMGKAGGLCYVLSALLVKLGCWCVERVSCVRYIHWLNLMLACKLYLHMCWISNYTSIIIPMNYFLSSYQPYTTPTYTPTVIYWSGRVLLSCLRLTPVPHTPNVFKNIAPTKYAYLYCIYIIPGTW